MSNETIVTLQGHVGGDVRLNQAGGFPVANFRLACTPRRRGKDGEWSDGPTQWYSVTAWRRLAEHVAASVGRGDPVVVQGRLEMKPYVNKAGVETFDVTVEAWAVGHDLNRGTSSFERRKLSAAPATVDDAATQPPTQPLTQPEQEVDAA